MVVLVTLETKLGDVEGMMNFCIPYLTIEPIISKLSAQYWYSSVRRGATTENLNTLRERLSTIDVNLVAEIGKMNLSMGEVLSLKPGDIVRLPSTNIDDEMHLKIGNRNKFLCRPGMLGNRVSVQITKVLEELTDLDYEELTEEGDE
jgi:flagellar motor switch protein FliM